jgi:heme exporter protein D
VYESVGGYSLYVWTMLALFVTAVLAVQRDQTSS